MKRIAALLLFFGLAILADPVQYRYDDAGRLILVDYGNGNNIAYTYDNAGNLLSRVVTSAASNSNASAPEVSKPQDQPAKPEGKRSTAKKARSRKPL